LKHNAKITLNPADLTIPTTHDAALILSTKYVLQAIKETIGHLKAPSPLAGTSWTVFDPTTLPLPFPLGGLSLILAKEFSLKIPNTQYTGQMTSASIFIANGGLQMSFNLQVEPKSGYTVDIAVTGTCSFTVSNGSIFITPGKFTSTHSVHTAWWVVFLDIVTLGVAAIVDGIIRAIASAAVNDNSVAADFKTALSSIGGINIIPNNNPALKLLKVNSVEIGPKNQVSIFLNL